MKFIQKHLFNIIMLCVIGYLAYQKFVVNAPNKDVALNQFQLVDANGASVDMNQFNGKVVFINFYSSWCGPCMVEMPSINKLYNELKEEDIHILLVNTTSLEDVKKFQARKNYKIPQYVLKSSEIEIKTIPLTYVINKKGEVVKVVNRPKNWGSKQSIHFLQKLIKD